MSFTLIVIFSFSILLAGIIGLIRFSKIRDIYYPFIYLVWIAGINEVLSYLLVTNGKQNIINSNLYGLAEACLLMWFFYNLNILKKNKTSYFALLAVFFVAWIVENFFVNSFGSSFSSFFIVLYSFPCVLFSISAINHIIITERDVVRHPAFLICIAIVIFFTYRILVEVFWFYGLDASKDFRMNVYDILIWINFLCNLIYALAILWMRKRQEFTLRF